MPPSTTSTIGSNSSAYSVVSSLPPPFSESTRDEDPEKWSLLDATSETPVSAGGGSSMSSLVPFPPTTQLQIQARGRTFQTPTITTTLDPITVFTLTPGGDLHQPVYVALRPKRSSGSGFLVDADDETKTPLTMTTYSFGPGKPPVVRITNPPHGEGEEDFQINSLGIFTRAQGMETRLGTFQWRYAGSMERGVEGADNLLIFEHVVPAGEGESKKSEQRTRVAQLVRNEIYRTPGTYRVGAGNGGRLMLNLRGFDEKERESVQILAVTTAIVMLKKETDRRR